MNFNEYQESARKYDTFSYEDFVRAGSKVSDVGVLEKVRHVTKLKRLFVTTMA